MALPRNYANHARRPPLLFLGGALLVRPDTVPHESRHGRPAHQARSRGRALPQGAPEPHVSPRVRVVTGLEKTLKGEIRVTDSAAGVSPVCGAMGHAPTTSGERSHDP